MALTGESAQATRLARDLANRFPEDSLVSAEYVPMILGAQALRNREPGTAISSLASAVRYEGGEDVSYYPAYLRGAAYVAAKDGRAAALEFQKILGHSGSVVYETIGPLAQLGMGRALALSGDIAKAKTAYQDFFAMWKDADPDIPILKEAKSEYAKLP